MDYVGALRRARADNTPGWDVSDLTYVTMILRPPEEQAETYKYQVGLQGRAWVMVDQRDTAELSYAQVQARGAPAHDSNALLSSETSLPEVASIENSGMLPKQQSQKKRVTRERMEDERKEQARQQEEDMDEERKEKMAGRSRNRR